LRAQYAPHRSNELARFGVSPPGSRRKFDTDDTELKSKRFPARELFRRSLH
jgi:hypothetical protein